MTREEVSVGLGSDIWPERDVIDENEEDSTHLCSYLMAAVVTQLFSYMIDKGMKYGDICAGKALSSSLGKLSRTSARSISIPSRVEATLSSMLDLSRESSYHIAYKMFLSCLACGKYTEQT